MPSIPDNEISNDIRKYYDISTRLTRINEALVSGIYNSSTGYRMFASGRVVVLSDNVSNGNLITHRRLINILQKYGEALAVLLRPGLPFAGADGRIDPTKVFHALIYTQSEVYPEATG
jgi:hypothetical protein